MNKFENLLPKKDESPEMKRRKYEVTLKFADIAENGFFNKLLGRGLKSEDIMIEEAYQQNDLIEKRKGEMQDEGRSEEEIKDTIEEINKDFENIDIIPKEVNIMGVNQVRLGGRINGHTVKLVRTMGRNKKVYSGKIDGIYLIPEEAEGLYKEYEKFALLKREAMEKAKKN